MNVSDRIQALRKSRGITQEQLADAVGVSRQAVSKWEAEQASPDLERIVAMAEFFDVTTDYLLRGIEPAKEQRSRADARTLCIVSTAMNAVGLIIGAALWRTYQNAFAPAFILSAHAAGLVLWLLAKGERPRWYWAINVWLLGVLPSYHGRGFARELVAAAKGVARGLGHKALRLDVLNGNLPAVRLYESEGFRFVSRVELFYEDTGLTDFLLYEYAL